MALTRPIPYASQLGRASDGSFSNSVQSPIHPEENIDREVEEELKKAKKNVWLPSQLLQFLPQRKGEPYENWFKRLEKYDEGVCKSWKDEIDKLLIFAGLFSAAVTAFAVEAFQWLEPGDQNTEVLVHISGQLANSVYGTASAPFRKDVFKPTAAAVRVNIFWFLSLVLSLTAVLLGIVCSQWLREFQADVTQHPLNMAISIRQIRYEGLVKWKVPQIISSLPVLLQVSVILFFVGLFDALHERNAMVSYVILFPMSLAVLFLAITTFAPGVQSVIWARKHASEKDTPDAPFPQCPYKSPQAWLFRRFLSRLIRPARRQTSPSQLYQPVPDTTWSSSGEKFLGADHHSSWIDVDLLHHSVTSKYHDARAWIWARENLCQESQMVYDLFHCFVGWKPEMMKGLLDLIRSKTNIRSRPTIPVWTTDDEIDQAFNDCEKHFRSALDEPTKDEVELINAARSDLLVLDFLCQNQLPPSREINRLSLELYYRLSHCHPSMNKSLHRRSDPDTAERDISIANLFDEQEGLLFITALRDPSIPLSTALPPSQILSPLVVVHNVVCAPRSIVCAQSVRPYILARIKDWVASPAVLNGLPQHERAAIAAEYLWGFSVEDCLESFEFGEEYVVVCMLVLRVLRHGLTMGPWSVYGNAQGMGISRLEQGLRAYVETILTSTLEMQPQRPPIGTSGFAAANKLASDGYKKDVSLFSSLAEGTKIQLKGLIPSLFPNERVQPPPGQ